MQVGYSCRPKGSPYRAQQLIPVLAALAAVLFVSSKLQDIFTAVKPVTLFSASRPNADPRTIRLNRFLVKLHCPIANLSEDFIEAADDNHLDWRLLPSIALIESGGGKAYIHGKNNIFGWGGGELEFPTLRAGLNQVAFKLGKSPRYRRHNSLGKLRLYNPDENYAQQVLAVMRRISPVVNLTKASESAVQRENEFVYVSTVAQTVASRRAGIPTR